MISALHTLGPNFTQNIVLFLFGFKWGGLLGGVTAFYIREEK